MSSSLFAALLVLQVFNACGDSLELNGVVGKSILLPTEERLLKGIGDMKWKKKSDDIITLVRKSENSPFEIRHIDLNFKGRLIVNNDTGALNISNLREEDSGEYVFGGIISSRSLKPATHKLQVYEMIVSVQVTTQVNNSTDSCNVTLSCSVCCNGSHQVALFWSTNGGNIPGTENKTTLTVSPTLAEENYTCTAKNPISSQNSSVTVKSCQTHGILSSLYIYIAAGVGGLLLVVMVIITLVCILKRSKRGEEQEDITVYAEIGEHTHAQKDSMYSQPPVPADVTTCYDVIKPTGNPAAPSTVYAMVNLHRPTAQQYQEVL